MDNTNSGANMSSRSPLQSPSRTGQHDPVYTTPGDRRLPALHLNTPVTYANQDLGLMPWAQPSEQRVEKIAHEINDFENLRPVHQPTVSSTNGPMDYWFRSGDQPRSYFQPDAQLAKSHPKYASPSEPAWSQQGSETFPQYGGAHESTTGSLSEYHSTYGFQQTASSWSGSPESKERVEFSPIYKGSSYSGASDNNSEPELSNAYNPSRGVYINPQEINSQQSQSGSDDEEYGPVPAIRLNNDYDYYPSLQPPMEVEPDKTSENSANLSPTSPSTRFSHRRARSGSGVSAGSMDPPLSPSLSRSLSSGQKPRGRAGNSSKVSKQTKDSYRSRDSRRHSQSNQVRPFCCTFYFAGCTSTFATKNEWKRHVQSQHMQQYIWRCDYPACVDRKAATFNRKDLFGQHLKRMHSPQAADAKSRNNNTSNKSNTTPEMNQFISTDMPRIQDRCKIERRPPPQYSVCGFCQKQFKGKDSWDKRMEHVGRHYESGENIGTDRWSTDENLVNWALQAGLVRITDNGGFAVVSSGKEAAVESVQAQA
ncbi:hypothetical protein EDC01DRAFT_652055 [Geopyxis carbonaria]|nr:hypothetical protein EDC01DRAFT_652055 [Geopyxis carbonaria]